MAGYGAGYGRSGRSAPRRKFDAKAAKRKRELLRSGDDGSAVGSGLKPMKPNGVMGKPDYWKTTPALPGWKKPDLKISDDVEDIGKADGKYKRNAVIGGGSALAAAGGVALYGRKVKIPHASVDVVNGMASTKGVRSVGAGQGHRMSNSTHVARIARSMKEKGFDPSQPIKIRRYQDGSMRVMDGNHRLQAAEFAGVDKVPVKVVHSSESTHKVRAPWFENPKKHLERVRRPNAALSDDELNSLADRKVPWHHKKYNELKSVSERKPHVVQAAGATSVAGAGGLYAANHRRDGVAKMNDSSEMMTSSGVSAAARRKKQPKVFYVSKRDKNDDRVDGAKRLVAGGGLYATGDFARETARKPVAWHEKTMPSVKEKIRKPKKFLTESVIVRDFKHGKGHRPRIAAGHLAGRTLQVAGVPLMVSGVARIVKPSGRRKDEFNIKDDVAKPMLSSVGAAPLADKLIGKRERAETEARVAQGTAAYFGAYGLKRALAPASLKGKAAASTGGALVTALASQPGISWYVDNRHKGKKKYDMFSTSVKLNKADDDVKPLTRNKRRELRDKLTNSKKHQRNLLYLSGASGLTGLTAAAAPSVVRGAARVLPKSAPKILRYEAKAERAKTYAPVLTTLSAGAGGVNSINFANTMKTEHKLDTSVSKNLVALADVVSRGAYDDDAPVSDEVLKAFALTSMVRRSPRPKMRRIRSGNMFRASAMPGIPRLKV